MRGDAGLSPSGGSEPRGEGRPGPPGPGAGWSWAEAEWGFAGPLGSVGLDWVSYFFCFSISYFKPN